MKMIKVIAMFGALFVSGGCANTSNLESVGDRVDETRKKSFSASRWSIKDSNAMDAKVKLQMWFDVTPPSKNSSFHSNAARVLQQLSENHDVIRKASLRDNSKIYSDEYIAKIVRESYSKTSIPNNFFYAAEAAQIYSLVKMTLNYCLLSGDCAAEGSEQEIANKLTNYAYSQTKKGRNRRQSQLTVSVEELGMIAVVGGALAATVMGLTEMISSADYSADKYTGTTENRWCRSDDTCFTILNENTAKRKISIQCTKGPYIGEKKAICGNSNGKWADGCGFTDAFAFHESSSRKAGNNACGYNNWLLN